MRKAFFLTLALVFVGLAGCSDGGSDAGSDAGSSSSASMTTTGPPPKPVVTSDALHLLAPPEMAPAIPAGSSESSTPTDQGFGPGGGGQDGTSAEWTYVMTAASNVTSAEVHLWIEITDTLVQQPNLDPLAQACTWRLSLQLGADSQPIVGCLNEPLGPINPDTRELVFNLVGVAAELEVNETVTLSFRRNAFSASSENSVFVLSGTEAHDSRASLKGLKEPVPDA
ncbi:MAG: hypothetical protein AABY18_03560 [Candidatus Thermoplasmatota archaeon]